MIPPIDIKHDMQGLSARLGLMANERVAAAVRSMNRTIFTVRAEASRSLGDEYPGLKIGAIKKGIKLTRADRATLRAALEFSNKRLRLMNWRLNRLQTKYGTGVKQSGQLPGQLLQVDAVSGKVSVLPAGGLSHAFIQRSKRFGIPNVWIRQGKASMPIDVLVTPSLSETLVQKKINTALARRARERFAVVFEQEGKFQLARSIGR
jgi:hypothetical protein